MRFPVVPTRQRPTRGALLSLLGLALLLNIPSPPAPAAGDRGPIPAQQIQLPLFRTAQETFSGGTPGRDLRLALPRSIALHAGSQLHLTLHPQSEPNAQPTALALAWNGRVLLVTNLLDPRNAPITLQANVPLPALAKGENVLGLRLVQLGTTNVPMAETAGARWLLLQPECFLLLNFSRAPLYEELARFPQTLAEEKLLHPDTATDAGRDPASAPADPVLSLILPGICGAAHLRVAAMAGARLGQLDYLRASDCRLAALESWKGETRRRNALIIARRDQLGGVDLPSPLVTALGSLGAGQGLLAEFFTGNEPLVHRVLLATAADDAGLEKVAFTLGSGPAMKTLTHSPAVLERMPMFQAAVEPGLAPTSRPIQGLYQIQQFLLTDPQARTALFAVPAGPSLEQVRLLFDLWLNLGRSLPGAAVLWPDVVTYQHGFAIDPTRCQGRNILAFGALSEWSHLLPADTPPALRLAGPESATVLIQGRKQRRDQLDPSLVFAELFPSPWSPTNTLILVGGWRDYALPATVRLLTDPASPALLAGDVAAMDERGRTACYDLRQVGSESFAERMRRIIPPGISAEQTAQRLAEESSRVTRAHQWNWRLSALCGAGCVLLILLRLVLMWQQTRLRQAALAAERAQSLNT